MDYEKIFEELKIPIYPLPSNYTPDEYGRFLLRDVYVPNAVEYSDSTNYDKSNNDILQKA